MEMTKKEEPAKEEQPTKLIKKIKTSGKNTLTPRTGRPKGAKTERETYKLFVYDITTEHYNEMGTFATFGDISKYLNSKGVHMTVSVVQNIYLQKTVHHFIRVLHL